jgi:hypothetical protein
MLQAAMTDEQPRTPYVLQTSGSGKSPELITLALETLGSFNFTGELIWSHVDIITHWYASKSTT